MPTAVTRTATASRAIGVSRRRGAGVAVAWQPGLRQPGGVLAVRAWRGGACGTRAAASKFEEEQVRLRPLPERRLETLERQQVRVSQGSTIQVKKNTYSVPARLIGERVEARIGAEEIEVWYAGSLVQTMERLRGQSKHRIDYRHVIDWLVRKPGAFARYVYRGGHVPECDLSAGL